MAKIKMKEDASVQIGDKTKTLRAGASYNLSDGILAQLEKGQYSAMRKTAAKKAVRSKSKA